MPTSPQSHHTSDLGVTEVRRICGQAAQIFREITVRDVGIDAFIEVDDHGVPTGDLIGLQIKSGNSYLSNDKKRAILPADADHFAYWARCAFPVIGAIHIPAKRKTYWINVTAGCTKQSILRGPYTLSVRCEKDSELNAATLQARVIPEALSMRRERLTPAETNGLLKARHSPTLLETSTSIELSDSGTWQQLVETVMSLSSTDADVANAAYRLGWYLPRVGKEQHAFLRKSLARCSQFQLAKILRAVHVIYSNGNDAAATIAADLVQYIPRFEKRIENLLAQQLLPAEAIDVTIQVLEVFGERDAPPQ